MIIQVDTREKAKAIRKILKEFDRQGVKYFVSKMYAGDYMSLDNPYLVIDRKQNLIELCQNVCQEHERFRNELQRAEDIGVHVIVLVEHGEGIEELEDVIFWENPRRSTSAKAMNGDTLYKVLTTMQGKYGVEFRFCNKNETGKRIIEILEEGNDERRDSTVCDYA